MITIEELRQFRIGGFAFFDLALSFLGMYLLAPILSKVFLKIGVEVPRLSWVLMTLPISILVHLLVGKMTLMTKEFVDLQGYYLIKVLILGMLVWGLSGIKIK